MIDPAREYFVGSKRRASWAVAFGVSLSALVCGAIALFNAGIVADENNLTSNPQSALWLMYGIGVAGLLVTLPGWLASRATDTQRQNG
ncbi:hypothetical protein [Paeniglutamicibacter kerguelensis]|uniref:ABC transporter permease n=1 Tax=Paeniglutamicibacter kerguelensis TaxID=254788 RepID=A0ABS4XCM0_9MICC|nr:hypothetical protein [Paeniglutamicibacter kerguelensis]MBP2386205.1 hypothetical protein [Paeniglutamicibacter kerguelensis]